MGLHTFHLNAATGVRWTSRAVVLLSAIGYLVEWFGSTPARGYLRLAWQSLWIWVQGGAPSSSAPPQAWHRMLDVLWGPPSVAVVVVVVAWLLFWGLRRRARAPAPAAPARGPEIVDSESLTAKIEREN